MKINEQAVAKLSKNTRNNLQVFNSTEKNMPTSSMVSCTIVMPSISQEYPSYAYVPYNREWGNIGTTHKVPVYITSTGIGMVHKDKVSSEMLQAIYKCLGEAKVKNSKYDIITFALEYKDGKIMIDRTSFAFCKKKEATLGLVDKLDVYLPVTVFMSPEGQRWLDEKKYAEYASHMRIIYQCSDDSIAHSYQEFKDWECELAYHPHNPVYPIYPECNNTLSSIGYLELGADGTIWRSQAMLEEYIHWQQDENSGMENGIYVGSYGTASNFIEYSSLYNAAYYSNAGLKRDEQFYGAHGLLYSNPEQAQKSIDKLNSFQKVKK